jgi:hypothetical protein
MPRRRADQWWRERESRLRRYRLRLELGLRLFEPGDYDAAEEFPQLAPLAGRTCQECTRLYTATHWRQMYCSKGCCKRAWERPCSQARQPPVSGAPAVPGGSVGPEGG